MKVILTIPLPPKGCSPNEMSHRHWRYRYQARDQYKQDVFLCAVKQKLPRFQGKVRMQATFYMARADYDDGNYRPRDEENAQASLKAVADSLESYGYIGGDSYYWVTWLPVKLYGRKKDHQGRCEVVVTIEEVED